MKLFLAKYIALRYLCAVIVITCAGLLANPKGIFIVIPVALMSLKFLAYEGVAAAIKAKFALFDPKLWLLAGYVVAIAGDMVFTYKAGLDEADAGFAFLGAILTTPWVLVLTLFGMFIAAFVGRKK